MQTEARQGERDRRSEINDGLTHIFQVRSRPANLQPVSTSESVLSGHSGGWKFHLFERE